MVQSALNAEPRSEPSVHKTLAERLDAELPLGTKLGAARAEPTVSSMAERFAPAISVKPHVTIDPPLSAANKLAPPEPASRFFSVPTVGVLVILFAGAVAPAGILAGLLWFGALRAPEPVHQASAIPSIALLQAAIEPSLAAPGEVAATAGESVAFPITVEDAEALPLRSAIAIRALPDGAAFSAGRAFGAGQWSLRPDEINGLTLRLPEGQTGTSELRVELVAADGAVLARTATRLDVAPPPTAGLVVRSGEQDRIGDLMAHGQKMIDVGYFAGARAYYKRAAEAGSAVAALAVGATYDPHFIATLRPQGIKPDEKEAETWYARAAALGLADREGALASLEKAWTTDMGEAAAETAEEEPAQPDAAEALKTIRSPGPLSRLVAAATEFTAGDEWVEVASAVNVRKGPSSNEETFKVAQKGTTLRVLGREGNWVRVTDPGTKQEGWIYTRFLKETDSP